LAFGQSSGPTGPTAAPTIGTTTQQETTTNEYVNCPNDWIDADILGCYKFLDAKINHTWVEAQYDCEQVGGYLAEPTTHRLSSFLHSLANFDEDMSGIKHWFIGLTDLAIEGNWNWIHTREIMTDDSWGNKRPVNKQGNKNDCGVMVLNKDSWHWEDWDCTLPEIQHSPVAPVCQRDTNTFITTSSPEPTTTPSTCESGWSEFEGSCYKHFPSSQYWQNAVAECGKYGSFLTIIHSKEEEDFVKNLSGNNFWMGGVYPSGGPTWIDGSPHDYGSFYNPYSNKCIYYYYNSAKFNTDNCDSSSLYYVCEKYL